MPTLMSNVYIEIANDPVGAFSYYGPLPRKGEAITLQVAPHEDHHVNLRVRVREIVYETDGPLDSSSVSCKLIRIIVEPI